MKHLTLLFLTAILASSCKKEKTEPVPETPVAPVNAAISEGIGTTRIHGLMRAQKNTDVISGSVSYGSGASFSGNATLLNNVYIYGFITSTAGVNAGDLKINSTNLKYNNAPGSYGVNQYIDTSDAKDYSGGVTWNLSAGSGFNSFTTKVNRSFPGISNTKNLPDSISKKFALAITAEPNNYSNADSVAILLLPRHGSALIKTVAGTAWSVLFQSSELANFPTGDADILVIAINYSHQTVEGKNYLYVMEHNLMKRIKINP